MSEPYVAPVATDMGGGNQRLRSQPGSNVSVMTYPLLPLTSSQWSDLNTFLRTALGNGASRFTMSVFTGAAYESKTVQLEPTKPPQVSSSGPLTNVTLTLRVFGMS